MRRYDALNRPPSLIDRFTQWVQERIDALLRLLFGNRGGPQAPLWWYYAVSMAVVAALVFIVVRASRGRFTENRGLPAGGPRPPADYFAEADRLASAGDRVGAIRALCAGVAATLAGERTWEGSPLTVRERLMAGSFDTPSPFTVMIVFTPTSPYTAEEAGKLVQWVRDSGGLLIYASERGDPELDRALGVIRSGGPVSTEGPYTAPPTLSGVTTVS